MKIELSDVPDIGIVYTFPYSSLNSSFEVKDIGLLEIKQASTLILFLPKPNVYPSGNTQLILRFPNSSITL